MFQLGAAICGYSDKEHGTEASITFEYKEYQLKVVSKGSYWKKMYCTHPLVLNNGTQLVGQNLHHKGL